jgi:hypothetical protein
LKEWRCVKAKQVFPLVGSVGRQVKAGPNRANSLTPDPRYSPRRTQRKNEADFISDQKRKTAPYEPTEGKKKPHPEGVSYRIGLAYKPALHLRIKSARRANLRGNKRARASVPPRTFLCDTTEKGKIADLSFE